MAVDPVALKARIDADPVLTAAANGAVTRLVNENPTTLTVGGPFVLNPALIDSATVRGTIPPATLTALSTVEREMFFAYTHHESALNTAALRTWLAGLNGGNTLFDAIVERAASAAETWFGEGVSISNTDVQAARAL